MNKQEIAPKLEKIMADVSVCEGLIYATILGKVLVGQTIIESDHAGIAKKVGLIFKIEFGEVQKGAFTDITIGMESGSLICVKKDDHILIGLLGDDGKSSIGLLRRQLINILK
jgi:hypothetical protein